MQKLQARVAKLKAINIAQLSDTPVQREERVAKSAVT